MSKAPIADQIVLAVKDQLRHVRYQIRSRAREDRAASRVPLNVAMAADAVFSQVQAAAHSLLPDGERKSANLLFPNPPRAYFAPADGREAPAFTSEIYYAIKGLLRRFGCGTFMVAEQAIEDARAELEAHHADLIAAALASDVGPGERAHRAAQLSAAIAVELAAARPIKELAPGPDSQQRPKNFMLSPNAYCAFVVGLAIAIAARIEAEPELDREIVIGSADMAVDARFTQLAAALKGREPVEALTREFTALLPFLP